jgi:hypothetical protein
VLYLAGSSGVRRFSTLEKWFRKEQTGQQHPSSCVRGNAGNDILISGSGGELLHYNGSSWYLYPELKMSGGDAFAIWYRVYSARDVVVVGGEFFTGLFGVPVVIRGSR